MASLRTLRPGPTAVLFACLFASQAGLLVLSPLLPEIAREFGISTPAAGQLRTISGLTGGLTAVLLAVAGRRPGLRTLLSAGAALVAAGSALSAAAPTFAVLAVAQAVIGVGIGTLVAIGIAAAGEWAAPEDRAHTLAWAIAGMPVAWIVGMPVVGAASSLDWRFAWLAVPAAAALAALALVRMRPADAPTQRTSSAAAAAWRRPEVARFAAGELLANAAWASVLTYSGALLIESYGSSRSTVALGLALVAVAMVPGTFLSRRHAAQPTMAALVGLTLAQGAAVVALASVRPGAGLTLGLLAVMAFVNGRRSMLASSLGMDSAPDDKVAVMAMRAASNQFGYLLGAAAGGVAIAVGGFTALGVTLGAMFVLGAFAHVPSWRPQVPAHAPRTAMALAAILLAVAAVGLAAPAGARADGSVTRVGTELRFDSDSQDAENLVITRQTAAFECAPGPAPCIQLANGPQIIRDEAADCVQVIAIVVACAPGSFTTIRLDLNDGDDFAVVGSNVPPARMFGSFGADNLSSGNGADKIAGGPGDDELFDDDDLGGDDVLDGGDGDDLISISRGDEDVVGGPGTDTVELDSSDDTVVLDDLANDGPAGDADNIHSDVEVVDGGFGSDNLFGNDKANTLVGGPGNDLIDGGAGPDVLDGGTGADDVAGGQGVDRVVYPGPDAQTITLDDVRDDGAPGELDLVRADIEDVEAGPGNDHIVGSDVANVLDGGDGDDRLDGRGGVDTYFGGAGLDALFARDGLQERVECGADADTGEADTIDLLVECDGVVATSDQVPDVDGDGSSKPADCDDANPAIHPGAVDILDNGIDEDCSGADGLDLDRDRDGVVRPTDCDDANPAIHPGAVDVAGNLVDEDCAGGPGDFPLLDSTIGTTFDTAKKFTVFTTLTVRRAHAGSTLRFTCSGKGCPFRAKTRTLKREQAALTLVRPLRRAKLRPGARFEVRVTSPGTVGVVSRSIVRAGKRPARSDLCLRPGSTRPARCTV